MICLADYTHCNCMHVPCLFRLLKAAFANSIDRHSCIHMNELNGADLYEKILSLFHHEIDI